MLPAKTMTNAERGNKHPTFLNVNNSGDELLGVKKLRYLQLRISEEERDAILSMFDECEQESVISNLQQKLRFLKQYIKAFFNRAHTE